MSDMGAMRGSKFEKHRYYRRPRSGENPGWITVGGTNMERLSDYLARGFEALTKFGNIPEEDAPHINGRTQWHCILEHPDGPREFPAEQIMELRWYKDEHCPVPGTKFPQLGGHSIREYQCPECNVLPFSAIDGMGGIEPLARHLRIQHKWERTALTKYGDKIGIDFDAIYSSIVHEYEFSGAKKEVKSGYGCSDCSWTPKANAKKPALALSLHAKSHEFTLETVEAIA